ncbi:MAG: NAD-binding protein [Bacilli bacterium]|nr:NAD-binding protein [Bacilli bacterium]
MANRVLIIGCGRLGAALAIRYAEQKYNVYVVDANSDSFEYLNDSDQFSGETIVGDAGDVETLEARCHIKEVDRVIITTGDDCLNLFLAHLCESRYHIKHIYVRLDSSELAPLLFGYNSVQTIFPFNLSIEKYTEMEGEEE